MKKKELYLAGGCFWGMQAYFDQIKGVKQTTVGYANGHVKNPTYDMVCHYDTGYAETLHIQYDASIVTLKFLLTMYTDVIDPTSYHKQGGDIGSQYRTGIYYVDEYDVSIIQDVLHQLAAQYEKPIVVECKPLEVFYPAEAYHQNYLKQHPGGYCHIPKAKIEEARKANNTPYHKQDTLSLRQRLDPLAYQVTQEKATEPAFHNAFWDHFEPGIYVDITTGEPLFVSSDKFDAGCGWPSFSKPIRPEVVQAEKDTSHGLDRTEVTSSYGDSHLGHVFSDGPSALGGMRYCINSAALRFIPLAEMKEEGYEAYIADVMKNT